MVAGGNLCAQAPLAAEPSVESRLLRAKYPRPDLKIELFKVSAIQLSAEEIDLVVRDLDMLARNFPDDRRITLEWRARILAIALRLRPDDRSCLVANGQLARGIQPLPVVEADLPTINEISLHFLDTAVRLFKTDSPDSRVLAHALLDFAAHLDESNRKVLQALRGEEKVIDWQSLLHPSRNADLQDEETADLQLESTAIVLYAHQGQSFGPLRIAAQADKLPQGPKRSLQFYYPNEVRRHIDPHLPALRELLRGRHPEWPSGWKVDMNMPSTLPVESAAAPLGVALVLESLIGGEPLDPLARAACGLNPAEASITKTASLDAILDRAKSEAVRLVIVSPANKEEIGDSLLIHPERLADLGRIPLVEARTFSECFALAQAHRPPALQRSLDQFADISKAVSENGLTVLRIPSTISSLEEILRFNPNLASARFLLAAARRELPTTLTRVGALRTLREIGAPIIGAVGARNPLQMGKWQHPLEATPYAKARIALERLRTLLDNECRGLGDAMVDLARIYDTIALYPPISPQGRQNYLNQIREPRKRMAAAFRLLEPQAPPPPEDVPPQG